MSLVSNRTSLVSRECTGSTNTSLSTIFKPVFVYYRNDLRGRHDFCSPQQCVVYHVCIIRTATSCDFLQSLAVLDLGSLGLEVTAYNDVTTAYNEKPPYIMKINIIRQVWHSIELDHIPTLQFF